jgi:putative serine/threonine protein kinase
LKKNPILELEKLVEEPYVSIVCYPKPSKVEAKKRLKELQKLGVRALEFAGRKRVFNVPVLGKGCVGIVTLAYMHGKKVALKIRRVDADRVKMQQEAKLLRKANSVQVGPTVLGVSKDFLVMQFIEGLLLPEWLEERRGKGRMRIVLREVLEQCWRLDGISLDHGELSHAPKHIIIDEDDKPFIVDFESASLCRKPSNVTSICQFLFIGSDTAKKVAERLGQIARDAIVEALRFYKISRTRENFEKVLRACDLYTM